MRKVCHYSPDGRNMMNNNMKTVFYIVLYSVIISGCTKTDTFINASNPFDYSIEQSRSCFCPQSGESVKLFVIADTIADAVWLSNNTHLSYDERQRFRTIKGLFAEIGQWDSSSSFQVSITIDSIDHFPSRVSIYPKPIIENDTLRGIILDASILDTTWNYAKYK
jgi:hypothetical protein